MQTQTPKAQPDSLLEGAPPTMAAGRRLTLRKAWVADINFEPNNGGIVLNLSEGGLGFRSIAPVQQNGPIRFWFSLQNQRVQASGELAWLDESKKIGGLRFTALPAEAREQIRHWIMAPGPPLTADATPARSVQALRRFFALGSVRPETNAAPVNSASIAVAPPKRTALTPWSWFSGGLALGAMLSAFIASLFVFHTNRRQLGESIIHFGERLAATPSTHNQAVPPAPVPAPAVTPEAASSAATPVAPLAAVASQAATNSNAASSPRLQQLKPDSAASTPAIPFVAAVSRPKLPANSDISAILALPPTMSSPAIALNSTLLPGKVDLVPPLEPAKYASAFIESSAKQPDADTPSEMYFEVGRFKDQFSAKQTKEKLAQLGFPADVMQKSRFWTNAYRVVVGPYNDDAEAKVGERSLVARGFHPQPFERGSRGFSLSYALTLDGKSMPVGDCIIRWESYGTSVVVQFMQGKYVAATADAKWAQRGVRYDHAAFVYIKGADGSRNLAEIRFAGMNRALVFRKLL